MDQPEEPLTSPHDSGLLAAYVEGRLDAGERRAMTVHLGACADCREALAMLARANAVVPFAAKSRRVVRPVWLALAATVLLATFAVRRLDGPIATNVEPGPVSTVGAIAPSSTPAASPASAEPGPRVSLTPVDPMQDPALLVKRGGLRQAGGKSFRLVSGEWLDTGFDPAASLPTVLVTGSDERTAAVERMPALRPYAEIGRRVVVVFEGTVYRFRP